MAVAKKAKRVTVAMLATEVAWSRTLTESL